MHKKKDLFILIVCIAVILFSFVYSLSLVSSQIVFGFDQARDAYEAYGIWHNHHIKILGPSSDIPGINHGVLWYYVLAVAYFIGGSLPEGAVYVLLLALYASLPLFWYFTYKMTQNIRVTAVAVAAYAMSPLYISFTHWLSNPTIALFISPVILYLLWKYVDKRTGIVAFLIGFFYGLLIQTDFGFIVLLFTLPLYYYVFRIRLELKNLFLIFCGLVIGTATFFITYLKFHTPIISIISHFVLGGAGKDAAIVTTLLNLVDNFIRILTITYLPLPQLLTLFVLLFIGFVYRKKIFIPQDRVLSLLGIWLPGIAILFIFNHGSLSATFLYAPFLYPLAILFAIVLTRIVTDIRILLPIFIGIGILQFMVSMQWSAHANSPLSVQQGMTTNHERELVNYVYQSAQNKPFVISTVTNPLSINTTWSYLFDFYGKPKHGYVPYFWGKSQNGYLGDLPMQEDLTKPTQRYLIIEPDAGIDAYWIKHSIGEEDLLSDVIEEKKFGNFTVQKRVFHPNKGKVATPAASIEKSDSL